MSEDSKDPNSWNKGWDWSRISVGALSIIAIIVGMTLVSKTPEGTSESGTALIAVGAVLSGAWLAITIYKEARK